MISIQTALVLGAGTSFPYDYPLGSQLIDDILNLGHEDPTEADKQWLELGIEDKDLISEFFASLKFSQRNSIDEFLEYRREFDYIGKIAIALTLIRRENDVQFFNVSPEDHWYRYLFNKMSTSFEGFERNKISFITFNYDRSLEHFLFLSLKSAYGKTDVECAQKLNLFPFVHVYGSLGPLPWQDPRGRPYGRGATPQQIISESSNILTFSEEATSHPRFKEAISFLSVAEQIVFLGFGYHDANLARLELHHISGKKLGSGFGLCKAEKEEIESKWGINIRDTTSVNQSFLREYVKWESSEPSNRGFEVL